MSTAPTTLAALRIILAARFPEKIRKSAGCVPTGIRAVDDALGGGLPGGRLTELVSREPSTGGQTVLASLLRTTRAARQRVALIDGADGFAPEVMPPDALKHLVWVRCRSLVDAFAAADLLVRDGNYAAIVLDLRGHEPRALGKTSPTQWHRLHRAAETGTVAMLVQTPCPLVRAVTWRLVLRVPRILSEHRTPRAALADTLAVEIVRGQADAAEELAG